MRYNVNFGRLLRLAWIVLILLFVRISHAAAGTEKYSFDSLGRLTKVEYADARIVEYTYDAAGNRRRVGATTSGATGVFLLVSGSHTSLGGSGDIATATIKNTGSQAITGIVRTCSSGGSWYPYGMAPTTIAAGASAQFSCRAAASGSYNIAMTFSGSGATNSPYQTPSW